MRGCWGGEKKRISHGIVESGAAKTKTYQVGRDKAGRVPVALDKHGVVGKEQDEEDHRDRVDREIRLQRRPVRELASVDALRLEAVEEPEVGDADSKPNNEAARAVVRFSRMPSRQLHARNRRVHETENKRT